MRQFAIIGAPTEEALKIERLAITQEALVARAKAVAIESQDAHVAQVLFDPTIATTDTITIDDVALPRLAEGLVTAVEHLIGDGIAVTRVEFCEKGDI